MLARERLFMISVRQTGVSSRASVRLHLAIDTIAGRIRDLYPLEFAHVDKQNNQRLLFDHYCLLPWGFNGYFFLEFMISSATL